MKPTDDIREFFENAPVNTNPRMDAAVLGKVLEAHDKTRPKPSVTTGPGVRGVIMKSPIVRFAVAAAIVAALLIGHGIVHNGEHVAVEPSGHTRIETLNLVSLNAVYRQGGMEALEQQYRKAFIDSQSRPARLSVERLLTELAENGES